MDNLYSIQINNITWSFFKYPFKDSNNTLNENLLHIHSHAELFFCFQGSIQLNFPNEKITLNENDACLVPAGVNHTKIPDNASNAVWDSIGLFTNKDNDTANSNERFDSRIFSILYGNKAFLFHNNTELHAIAQKILFEDVVNTVTLLELICILYKASVSNMDKIITVTKETHEKDMQRLLLLDHIINTEYDKSPSSAEIADRLFITTRQLSRIVRANFGTSLHKLFIKRRLFCAATLLVETDLSIDEICSLVGFSNKSFFYQNFKKEFGTTPACYRAEKQKS